MVIYSKLYTPVIVPLLNIYVKEINAAKPTQKTYSTVYLYFVDHDICQKSSHLATKKKKLCNTKTYAQERP